MMRRHRRMISPNGVPQMTTARAMQLQVIRGVLTKALTIEQGAARLAMPAPELLRLVMGARRAVIDTLGEDALERARQAEQHASMSSR
ncbi:MAG: hypothetical protein JWO36_6414 [Myxococcales bacterium]|nr:hypothetical protein [Myxococcales bacterium]